ncbi:MAG: cellulase family glycosylhydrolase [Mycobacterium sp.]
MGAATAVGAFLALGMAPLTGAPTAQADIGDAWIDPIFDSLSTSTSVVGLSDPAWLDLSHWVPGAAGTDGVPAGLSATDPAVLFNDNIYLPIHQGIENWINDSNNAALLDAINQPFVTLFGRDLIGDGVQIGRDNWDGANDSIFGASGVFGDLHDGGLLFGDGGSGSDGSEAGVAGGNGGAAGIFGNGGSGGFGGEGAAGGPGGTGGWLFGNGGTGGDGGSGGGDGGNGAGLFSDGGAGGNAGDGGDPGALPALGGAGGNAGLLGHHGAVGHYGTLAGAPASASTDGLSTTGNWITDSAGKVVILHGLNQMINLPPYEPSGGGFGEDDAQFLEDNGFTTVRLGVVWAAVEPDPGVINYAYLDSIKDTVQMLGEHHIVSLLDMTQGLYASEFGGQGAPDWAVQTGGLPNIQAGFPFTYLLSPAENHAWDAFWSNAKAPDDVGLENHYAQMYENVADYFKGDPDVVGYEVMNEPWAGSSWPGTLFGSPTFEAQQLTPFYNQVASAIRAVDPTTPVFYQPNSLFNEAVPTQLGTVDQPHTVFSFHDYCFLDSVDFLRPLSSLCGPYLDLIAENAESYAGPLGLPSFMTEFGSTNNLGLIADTMQVANQNKLGWMEFSYAGADNPTITGQPELVYNTTLPPVGDNVDSAKLATIVEPYPQVVAGTPNSWSFDNGVFTFSYSTEMADGNGSFGAGEQTTLSVPALQYPNGYQVSVTGGHVVSAPNAPELIIASDGSATTINVTVSATAGAG